MRVAVDTNILLYAEGLDGAARRDEAVRVIGRIPARDVLVPVQVLGELFVVLVRKAKWRVDEARDAVAMWRDLHPSLDTTDATILSAIELVAAHRLAFWDAVILAAAAEAGCRFLLSEDMQPGFTWRSTTIADPFGADLHPLLAGLIRPPA